MPPEDAKATCTLCGGTGRTDVDNLTVRLCVCLLAEMCRDFLGTDLRLAEKITASPVFEAKKGLDRTGENLFLKTKWRPFRSHLRYALGCKWFINHGYRFRVVTDERLFQVYIGNESYTQRSKAKRDERESFNNLADIIEDMDLVIIRLGFLGWKNVAAPGVLKMALMIREAALKPTWIVTCDQTFGPGHYSYSPEVLEYIDERFDVLDFSKEQEKEEAPAREPVQAVEDISAGSKRPEPPEPPGGSFDAVASDHSDLFGENRAGSAKPGQRPKKSTWNKKKPGGGGGSPMGDL